MCPVFRSPSTRSVEAAITPARLADQFDGMVLWHERADGELDVAVLRDGRIDCYVVHEDGSKTLVGSSPPSLPQRWGGRIAIGAWAVALVTIVVMGMTDPDGTASKSGLVALWFACFALFGIGGYLGSKRDDLEGRLKKVPGGEGEWHMPTKLNGWIPRSSAQLRAVEQIADDHDGLALVHDLGARTVDVAGVRKGRLERYWVDEFGRADLAETTPPGPRHDLQRALGALAIMIGLGLVAVWFAVDEHRALFLVALVMGLLLLMVAAWLNDRSLRLENRVKRAGSDGMPWIEIRTLIEENDGG
jgi:hypothetical protein